MRRSWRITAALALVLAAGSILFSAYLYTRIQNERTRTLVSSCVRDSQQSQAIINFLEDLGSRPKTVDRARVFFPVVSQKVCERRAKERVGPPPVRR